MKKYITPCTEIFRVKSEAILVVSRGIQDELDELIILDELQDTEATGPQLAPSRVWKNNNAD